MNKDEEKVPDVKDQSTIVSLLTEAMNHLRHCQQLRASYLNFYLVLYAAAFGAFIAISDFESADKNLVALTSWGIGIFVWITGLITVMRAERWTGHTLHNLFIFRRLRHILQERNPLLRRAFKKKPKLVATNEFRRFPWSRAKAIDSFLAMIGAATGGLPWIVYPPENEITLGVAVAIIIAISPLIVWWREVTYLEKAHREYCFTYPDNNEHD